MPLEQAVEQAGALSRGLLDALERTGETPREALEQLCALATSEDPAVARAGSLALFRNVVEPLGDSFDPQADARYVRFFSGVIDYCRRQPAFHAFDGLLRELGIQTKRQLLDRAARIRTLRAPAPLSNAAIQRVQTVLAPSRVTLGADIAVTSVILGRMKALFPCAQMALLGSAKTGSLFASDPRVSLVDTTYPRGGTLRHRLEAWMTLCESVSQRLKGLVPDEYVIVDPDSRLTQLGLLPLDSDDSRYYFFESRSYALPAVEQLPLLAGCWLDEAFGFAQRVTRQAAPKPIQRDASPGYQPQYPYVALSADDMARGKTLRVQAGRPLAAVNLGIGGNVEKQVDDPFEAELLGALLRSGYTLVLDRGAGEEELTRTGRLIASLRGAGKVVTDVPATARPPAAGGTPADVYVWEGSLSGFGGLIAASELYCGYDSAGGHLAAAIGVPVITIFTDAQRPQFIQRWTPWGRGSVRAITASRSAPREALRQFQAALREQPL